jgi:hypothetical protein
MTADDGFLSRWSRRKVQADLETRMQEDRLPAVVAQAARCGAEQAVVE